MLGGIEAGGTKMVCAVAHAPGAPLTTATLPTTTPDETFAAIRAFFAQHPPLTALGVAAFGPIETRPGAPNHTTVLETPKPGWTGASYREALGDLAPVLALDTDVNAAALAEQRWGAGRGCDPLAYVTVGTGIGVGVVAGGAPRSGVGHYEIGHIRPARAPGDGEFPGVCPFHGDCLEGLASGPAIIARWGADLSALADPAPAIAIEAHYLTELAATLVFTHMPARIVFGGGVMRTPRLLEAVRARLPGRIGRYGAARALVEAPDYLTPPGLADQSGVIGALTLAAGAAGA